jgi:hypothetical protein
MQISRHWRLNAQRYRLQGVRYENGEVSLQERPAPIHTQPVAKTTIAITKDDKVSLKVAS